MPPTRQQRDRIKLRDRQAPHPRHQRGGSKKAALAIAYKLINAAQQRWRQSNCHELIADVLTGATFKDGIRVMNDDKTDKKVVA